MKEFLNLILAMFFMRFRGVFSFIIMTLLFTVAAIISDIFTLIYILTKVVIYENYLS